MREDTRVAVAAPRINANDDVVRIVRVLKGAGELVHTGDALAEISSDKATFVVEAEVGGRIVDVCVADGQVIDVDATLMWVACEHEPAAPAPAPEPLPPPAASLPPTVKARMLLERHGLTAASVPFAGPRLTAADVLMHLEAASGLPADARSIPLSPEERAMVRAIEWHHRDAVPAYLEVAFDEAAWRARADEFRLHHNLLFDPLLALLVWRLARVVAEQPRLNSAVINGRRVLRDAVNVGVTVQTDMCLHLVVVRDAERLSPRQTFDRLAELQRRAINDELSVEDIANTTVGFTSMARWDVRRHVPLLPPRTSLIVAHSGEGNGLLGATYDHRALTGGDVAAALNQFVNLPSRLELARWTITN